LARGKIEAGTNASYITPQMKSARVVPRSDNENLAPSGSAHIIVAHSMDKQLPPSAPAASAVMPALASSQKQTLCGQNDDIEFRRTTLILHV
jgi:hypothetical protein